MARMSSTLAPTLQVFRPGRHTAMSGQTLAFGEADLAATAAAYDPAKHEAPIVVGHPRHDGPAYGWIKGLRVADGSLEAEHQQVDPAFAELVAAGRYKKISASFYAPDSPSNPVPGVYYLRHIGFLGAQPPAVKGLRTPSFSEGEPGVVEFGDAWDEATGARLWRNLREWLLAKFDAPTADQVVPQYEVASLERAANEEINREMGLGPDGQPAADAGDTAPPGTVACSEFNHPAETSVNPQEAAALQAENARLKAELDAQRKAQRDQRRAAAHAEHTAFAEQLVGVPESRRPLVVALLDHLADQDAPLQYGEGAERKPLAGELRELLGALPAPVAFGEHATGGRAVEPVLGYAEAGGATVHADKAKLDAQVRAHRARHPALTYEQALDAVRAGRAA